MEGKGGLVCSRDVEKTTMLTFLGWMSGIGIMGWSRVGFVLYRNDSGMQYSWIVGLG